MKTAVIYGSTGTGKGVYAKINDTYEVLYFVDENPARIGQSNDGIQICAREKIFDNPPDVVVMGMLTGLEEAVSYLMAHGIAEEQIVTKYVDLSMRARRAALEGMKEIIVSLGGADGAVAELGVYRGDFAKVINEVFPDRTLYLFDTFEGFPETDILYEQTNGFLKNEIGRLANTSVDYVLGKLPHPEKCVIRKGYFPETVKGLENESYVFVNLDADLYSPTAAGLEYFWSRMMQGGFIMVHDYFSNAYDGAKRAIEEFAYKANAGFVPVGDGYSVAFCKKGEGNP